MQADRVFSHNLFSLKRGSLAMAISLGLHAAILVVVAWNSSTLFDSAPVGLTLELLTAPQSSTGSITPQIARKAATPKAVKPSSAIPVEPAAATTDVGETSEASSKESAAKFGTASGDASVMNQYIAVLIAELQKNRSYPRESINREEEGVVSLSVRVAASGDILEATIKDASPFESLNKAALKTVQKIRQFPKPPIETGSSIDLTIPMRFKIERL